MSLEACKNNHHHQQPSDQENNPRLAHTQGKKKKKHLNKKHTMGATVIERHKIWCFGALMQNEQMETVSQRKPAGKARLHPPRSSPCPPGGASSLPLRAEEVAVSARFPVASGQEREIAICGLPKLWASSATG
ncbi:hypothetical protein EYF80_012835 [Liparis tanakae]|uniref:Uncharacterized protein n=1 Tax=Liparis tanakae TaxID=230148 RepID=A0A4Z2IG51_9TELE|nr:hypothetical protein EYF80_012835 [Liparis tanakae]